MAKSKDDEYLRDSLAFSHFSSLSEDSEISKKALESYKKRPSKYPLLKDFAPVVLDEMVSGSYTADINRLNKVFEYLGKGIYFKQSKRKYFDEVLVIPYFLYFRRQNLIPLMNDPVYQYELLSKIFTSIKPEGDNPEIFSYKTLIGPSSSTLGYWLTFYQGSEAFVGFYKHFEELENNYGLVRT